MPLPRLILPMVAAGLLAGAATGDPPVACETRAVTVESGKPLGVQVRLGARIAAPVAGHEYRLMCQYRVHTGKGQVGPVLGDAARPEARAYDLGALRADDRGGRGLDADRDVNRQDLSGMTHLPAGRVILRVEPHVYDATSKAFVTPPRTEAAIVFLVADPTGRVSSVASFADWFPNEFGGEKPARAAIRLAAEIDAWHQPEFDSDLLDAYGRVIAHARNGKPAVAYGIAIAAVPANLVNGKNLLHFHLRATVDDPESAAEVREAARVKLAEADAALKK